MTREPFAPMPHATPLQAASHLARWWPTLLLGVAMLIGLPARYAFGHGMPLWFDETFSAVIASQPTVARLLHWCLNELTGPGYYGSLWLWVRLFGNSDVALRLPSLLFSFAAPVLILRWGHPDRTVRLFWCAVLLLWLPALIFANDARPYAQLVFLASLQGIAFTQMLRTPTVRTALLWTSICTLMGLTHYYALLIVGVQGLMYLAIHRQRALATWPAMAPVALLVGWMAVHLSFVLHFSSGHGAAYAASSPALLLTIPALLFGTQVHGALLLAVIGGATALFWRAPLQEAEATPSLIPGRPETMFILSGVIAFAGLLVFGLIHAGFAARYLTPFQPALLFGVAWWARWMIRRSAKPVIAMFVIMAMAMGGTFISALTDHSLDDRHLFNMERPSAWLMQNNPTRMVFVWADPVGVLSAMNPDQRARTVELGGFFFRRDGRRIEMVMPRMDLVPPSGGAVHALAGDDPHSVILWIANDLSSAQHIVPHLDDARWQCREFGEQQVTVIACRRKLQAVRSARTVSPAVETSAKPPSIAISSGSPFSVR